MVGIYKLKIFLTKREHKSTVAHIVFSESLSQSA